MLGLDTNLLIRYLVHDDPVQFGRARAEIEAAADRGEPLMINAVVLCEVVWVLGSAYEYSRAEITDALEQILATAQFVIEWGDRHARRCRIAGRRRPDSPTPSLAASTARSVRRPP